MPSGLKYIAHQIISIAEAKEKPQIDVIKDYIKKVAEDYGVSLERAFFIVEKESQFESSRVGDTDKICPQGINKGKVQRARGLWQINDCYHPEISDAVAFDIFASTDWAMPRVKNNPNIWSVWRFRKEWYKKSPE